MRTPGATTRTAKRQPCARDRAWTSMRVLRRFTLPDLVATAEISLRNASEYCRGLVRSGVIRVVTPRRSGEKGGHVVYQLIRDLGPHAPRLRRDGTTFDINDRSVIPGGIANDRWSK